MTSEKQPKSWTQNLSLTSMTIELSAFFLMVSTLMGGILMQDVQILSACTVTRNNSRDLCRQLVKNNESFHSEEVAIQQVVAEAQAYSSVMNNVLALIFLLVAGPWSDRHGRRGVLLLTLGGSILSSGVMLTAALFYDGVSPYLIAVLTSASSSVFGGETGFTMAAFGYLCDITEASSRTFRTGLFMAAYHLGVPVGYAVLGVVIRSDLEYGYPIGFGVALVFSLISFALVGVGVKGGVQNQGMRIKHKNYSTLAQDVDKKLSPSASGRLGCCSSLWDLLSSSLLPIFKLLGSGNGGRRRTYLILIILLHVLGAAPIHGDASILYLFFRQRLGWDVAAYGNFSIYDQIIKVVGMSGTMLLLSRYLKMRDPTIGFISTWSPLAASFLYAFALNPTTVWLAPAVDMLNLVIIVVAKSMLSKVVGEGDIGKGVTLTSFFEVVTPLLFIPLYNWIYTASVATFPGATFLLSAGLTGGVLLIYLWFIFDKNYATLVQLNEERIRDEEKERIVWG